MCAWLQKIINILIAPHIFRAVPQSSLRDRLCSIVLSKPPIKWLTVPMLCLFFFKLTWSYQIKSHTRIQGSNEKAQKNYMPRRYEWKHYCGYVSNLPQLEIVDTGYEVVAKHQLNDLYCGVSNSFPPRLERYVGKKSSRQSLMIRLDTQHESK